MAHTDHLGANPNLLDLYRRYPAIAKHVLGLAEASFTLTDQISHGECEMIGAYISRMNGCGYCAGIHTEAAVASGIDRATLPTAGIDPPSYGTEKWSRLFAYVRALTLQPASVDRTLVQSLIDAGWQEDVIAQLAAICCAFNVLNRLVEGLGLSADPSFYAQAGKRLATVGYGGTAKMLGVA